MPVAQQHYLPHTRVPTLVFPTSGAASKFVAREIEKPHPRRQRRRPADRARARHRLHPRRPLPRTDPAAQGRRARLLPRRHLQPRRVLPDGPGGPALLLPARCTRPSSTTSTSSGRTSTSPTAPSTPDDVDAFCADYERKIRGAGGIDVQVLGIGRTGHIGFNEPGSPRNSRTRLVTLDSITRRDAAGRLLRRGERPATRRSPWASPPSSTPARSSCWRSASTRRRPSYKAAEQAPTEAITASFLQDHADATFVLDQAAAAELTAVKRPWEVGPVDWTPETVRRAVVHLSLSTGKGLQKLNDDDFREYHLYDLLREHGPAEQHRRGGVPRPAGDDQAVPGRPRPARRCWSSARTRTTT